MILCCYKRCIFYSLKLFKQGGAQETGQIKQIKVLAGDINDFYVEMTYTSTITYLGETETMDITYKYRIKKGKDCYLVAFIGYRVPGDIGLVKCDPVIEKDVSTNEKLCIFCRRTVEMKDKKKWIIGISAVFY